MIDFNYPIVRTFIISFLFIPFCVYHVIFVAWANAVYENRFMSVEYERANLGCAIVLLIFSAYFLLNEVRQVFREGIEYLISVWNYLDLLSPVGIVFTMIMVLLQHAEHEIN